MFNKKIDLTKLDYQDHSIYYDLIEYEYEKGKFLHIPMPIFVYNLNVQSVKKFKVKVSKKIRNSEFFICPVCNEKSFYRCQCLDTAVYVAIFGMPNNDIDIDKKLINTITNGQRVYCYYIDDINDPEYNEVIDLTFKKQQIKNQILSDPKKFQKKLMYIRADIRYY